MIFLKHNKWHAKVRVPKPLIDAHGETVSPAFAWHIGQARGRSLGTGMGGSLRLEWQTKLSGAEFGPQDLRAIYAKTREVATAGAYRIHIADEDPVVAGVDFEIDKIADVAVTKGALPPAEEIKLMALQDAKAELVGQPVPRRPQLEPPFSEVADAFMAQWLTKAGLKQTNTAQQKRATFKLFAGFWRDKPMRGIAEADVANFFDTLRHLRPEWARSSKARELSWAELTRKYSDTKQALSDATMNRHMQALQALWKWAKRRGHCEGDNPFEGFGQKLTLDKNVQTYRAWETDELKRLLSPPPSRKDLSEVIMVGMFTAMRLDEIASLTWGQIRCEDGVHYIQIDDAKTQAGIRQVPLHPALSWLHQRKGNKRRGGSGPRSTRKAPAKSRGRCQPRVLPLQARSRILDRTKVFHSFRKNVTRQMERAGVLENEWAQVFGHERGFTYKRYNPDGITLERKAEIIGIIDYPGLDVGALLLG
jgi:integrase